MLFCGKMRSVFAFLSLSLEVSLQIERLNGCHAATCFSFTAAQYNFTWMTDLSSCQLASGILVVSQRPAIHGNAIFCHTARTTHAHTHPCLHPHPQKRRASSYPGKAVRGKTCCLWITWQTPVSIWSNLSLIICLSVLHMEKHSFLFLAAQSVTYCCFPLTETCWTVRRMVEPMVRLVTTGQGFFCLSLKMFCCIVLVCFFYV